MVVCAVVQVASMQAAKEAFLAQDALAVVTALVAEPLARHPRMSQQDAMLVQLVITFLRNLLAIPDQDTAAGILAFGRVAMALLDI